MDLFFRWLFDRLRGRKRSPQDYDIPPFEVHEGWMPVWRGDHRRSAQ